MTPKILAPRCPGCDSPPMIAGMEPAFCPNTNCKVLCWDQYAPPERFKAEAITLDLEDVDGSIKAINQAVAKGSPSDLCSCGHSRAAHEHWRAGTECAFCGVADCPAFRSPGE